MASDFSYWICWYWHACSWSFTKRKGTSFHPLANPMKNMRFKSHPKKNTELSSGFSKTSRDHSEHLGFIFPFKSQKVEK